MVRGEGPERGGSRMFPELPALTGEKLTPLLPDFLIIAPPKTASTWLADNLRCHAELFVPAVKELRYFSSLHKWLDASWYLDQFLPAGSRLKGEASPSYAILPVERIRLIRRLMPNVKLLFLMRDPVARAWSHAKHCFRFREINLAASTEPFEEISDSKWCEVCAHEWCLASGDYLGQLRRWLSVFPREQLFVEFSESIAARPREVLRDIFEFLGVNAEVDFSVFPFAEKILPGLPGAPPPVVQCFLRQRLSGRLGELAGYLLDHFNMRFPPEWSASIVEADEDCSSSILSAGASGGHALSQSLTSSGVAGAGLASGSGRDAFFSRDLDDRFLTQVAAHEEQCPLGPRQMRNAYRGYSLVFYRRRFYALDQALGTIDLEAASEAQLQRFQRRGSCLSAATLDEVKQEVDHCVLARSQAGCRAFAAP